MNDQPEVQASPVVKVARDLTEIVRMAEHLDDQAEHKANARIDGHALPGGLAMVALAPVANLEAWEHRYQSAEREGRDTSYVEDEDDSWEPPLQTLCFWSEQWRNHHGAEYGKRPTVTTEANFIRWALDWAWDNLPEWDDFAADIRAARVRMENVLYAGERVERGAPCLYDECRGRRIIRKIVPTRGDDGEKAYRLSDWHCPNCKRSWDEAGYQAMVTAAHESTKFEDIDGTTWCTTDWAARRVGRSDATIRQWLHKGYLATVCIIAGRRTRFVSLADVIERDATSARRKRAA